MHYARKLGEMISPLILGEKRGSFLQQGSTRRILRFKNGSTISFVSNAERNVRGLGPKILICDEVSSWPMISFDGRDIKTFLNAIRSRMIAQHGKNGDTPCAGCHELLAYAGKRLEKCPYDPKPKCKDCKTHCYKPEYQKKIREVMRFSGMHFVKRGRVDWLVRYFA